MNCHPFLIVLPSVLCPGNRQFCPQGIFWDAPAHGTGVGPMVRKEQYPAYRRLDSNAPIFVSLLSIVTAATDTSNTSISKTKYFGVWCFYSCIYSLCFFVIGSLTNSSFAKILSVSGIAGTVILVFLDNILVVSLVNVQKRDFSLSTSCCRCCLSHPGHRP